jgi:hypothetical protein
LYLPDAKLTSYSIGLVHVSNGAKILVAGGAYSICG